MIAPAESPSRTAFLEWLDGWHDALHPTSLAEVMAGAGGAERVGIMVVDLLVGFCSEGPLASPRVAALGPATATFLKAAWSAGIRSLLLAMDAHPPDSPEFASFPPHCIAGTREAELIDELKALPFIRDAVTLSKRSLNVGLEDGLGRWQAAREPIRAWIILGDCTDLCVYQAAMHLRLHANASGEDLTVWVPSDLVGTYDMPVETAEERGAMPHDGDLMHRLFLYHMALNGIRVVRHIAA